jgi:hypothetical protein
MGNPYDFSFVYPLIAGATSLFLVANDLFAGISAFFALIVLVITLFEKLMTYHASRPPRGLIMISIGFFLFSATGQAIIYFNGGWPVKMGIFQYSPLLTIVLLVFSITALLIAEAIRT